jgi:hypothetical protein
MARPQVADRGGGLDVHILAAQAIFISSRFTNSRLWFSLNLRKLRKRKHNIKEECCKNLSRKMTMWGPSGD